MPDKKVKVGITLDGKGVESGANKINAALGGVGQKLKSTPQQATGKWAVLNQKIATINPTLQKVGSGLIAFGAVNTAILIVATKRADDYIERLKDMSQTLGTNQLETQAWGRILGKVNLPIEQMTMVSAQLAAKLDEASQGSKTAQDAFSRIGISWQQLKAKSPADALADVVTQLNRIGDGQQKLAAAADLGLTGRNAKILAVGDAVKAIADESKSTTFVSQEQLDKISAMNDEMNALKINVEGVFLKAFSGAAPVITEFLEHANKLLEWVGKAIDEHPKLAAAMALVWSASGPLSTGAGFLVKIIGYTAGLRKVNALLTALSGGAAAAEAGAGAASAAAGAAAGGGFAALATSLGLIAGIAVAAGAAIYLLAKDLQNAKRAAEADAATAANQEKFRATLQDHVAQGKLTQRQAQQLAPPTHNFWTGAANKLTHGWFDRHRTEAWANTPFPTRSSGGGVTVNQQFNMNGVTPDRVVDHVRREGKATARRLEAVGVG